MRKEKEYKVIRAEIDAYTLINTLSFKDVFQYAYQDLETEEIIEVKPLPNSTDFGIMSDAWIPVVKIECINGVVYSTNWKGQNENRVNNISW